MLNFGDRAIRLDDGVFLKMLSFLKNTEDEPRGYPVKPPVLDGRISAATIGMDMSILRFVSVNQPACPRLDHSD